MPYKHKEDKAAQMRRYRKKKAQELKELQRKANTVPCCICDERGHFKEIKLFSNPHIKAYICEDCLKKLPKKFVGLAVKYKGEVIGTIMNAELVDDV